MASVAGAQSWLDTSRPGLPLECNEAELEVCVPVHRMGYRLLQGVYPGLLPSMSPPASPTPATQPQPQQQQQPQQQPPLPPAGKFKEAFGALFGRKPARKQSTTQPNLASMPSNTPSSQSGSGLDSQPSPRPATPGTCGAKAAAMPHTSTHAGPCATNPALSVASSVPSHGLHSALSAPEPQVNPQYGPAVPPAYSYDATSSAAACPHTLYPAAAAPAARAYSNSPTDAASHAWPYNACATVEQGELLHDQQRSSPTNMLPGQNTKIAMRESRHTSAAGTTQQSQSLGPMASAVLRLASIRASASAEVSYPLISCPREQPHSACHEANSPHASHAPELQTVARGDAQQAYSHHMTAAAAARQAHSDTGCAPAPVAAMKQHDNQQLLQATQQPSVAAEDKQYGCQAVQQYHSHQTLDAAADTTHGYPASATPKAPALQLEIPDPSTAPAAAVFTHPHKAATSPNGACPGSPFAAAARTPFSVEPTQGRQSNLAACTNVLPGQGPNMAVLDSRHASAPSAKQQSRSLGPMASGVLRTAGIRASVNAEDNTLVSSLSSAQQSHQALPTLAQDAESEQSCSAPLTPSPTPRQNSNTGPSPAAAQAEGTPGMQTDSALKSPPNLAIPPPISAQHGSTHSPSSYRPIYGAAKPAGNTPSSAHAPHKQGTAVYVFTPGPLAAARALTAPMPRLVAVQFKLPQSRHQLASNMHGTARNGYGPALGVHYMGPLAAAVTRAAAAADRFSTTVEARHQLHQPMHSSTPTSTARAASVAHSIASMDNSMHGSVAIATLSGQLHGDCAAVEAEAAASMATVNAVAPQDTESMGAVNDFILGPAHDIQVSTSTANTDSGSVVIAGVNEASIAVPLATTVCSTSDADAEPAQPMQISSAMQTCTTSGTSHVLDAACCINSARNITQETAVITAETDHMLDLPTAAATAGSMGGCSVTGTQAPVLRQTEPAMHISTAMGHAHEPSLTCCTGSTQDSMEAAAGTDQMHDLQTAAVSGTDVSTAGISIIDAQLHVPQFMQAKSASHTGTLSATIAGNDARSGHDSSGYTHGSAVAAARTEHMHCQLTATTAGLADSKAVNSTIQCQTQPYHSRQDSVPRSIVSTVPGPSHELNINSSVSGTSSSPHSPAAAAAALEGQLTTLTRSMTVSTLDPCTPGLTTDVAATSCVAAHELLTSLMAEAVSTTQLTMVAEDRRGKAYVAGAAGQGKAHDQVLQGTAAMEAAAAGSARRILNTTMALAPATPSPSAKVTQPSPNVEVNEDAVYQKGVLSRLRIPWHSITMGKVLGKGGTGTVHKGMWQGSPVAVKMLAVDRLSSGAKKALHQEALAMCELRHPCIAHVYGLVDDGPHCALVMRYYKRGTVAAAISKPEYCAIELVTRLRMALQVASGMCCLHERQMLHGDLKTLNLLIEDDGRSVVIADFGLSGTAGQSVASGAMTVSISPPEVLRDPIAPRTAAADVYAFGIVLLEIVGGRFVYQNMSRDRLRAAVCNGHRPPIPANVPDDVASIITACWAQEASARPTFPSIMMMLDEALEEQIGTRKRLQGVDETQTGLWDTTIATAPWVLRND